MDKTLDEIISTRPKAGRRPSNRRPPAKAQILGSPANSPATRARAAPATNGTKTAPQPTDKIMVSNLPTDVNEVQIRELFTTTVGPLREVTLHYDSKGISKGVAAVQFQRKGDGTKAYQQYNNRLIDGTFVEHGGEGTRSIPEMHLRPVPVQIHLQTPMKMHDEGLRMVATLHIELAILRIWRIGALREAKSTLSNCLNIFRWGLIDLIWTSDVGLAVVAGVAILRLV
ncbi:hypothetical protein EW026_g1228 [Hermanssonia centrifuga]|uniref:RRM domain-containing protein n=1 Tax=Hermanssonia centrifuga TaxID=98765 RepID=A0A4S4KTR0_9APHY|nr:hypothetical protein EW026_g1228 [Hermanssonia centrifuga]